MNTFSDALVCPTCRSDIVEIVDESSGRDASSWNAPVTQPSLHDLIRREISLLRTPLAFGGFGDETILRSVMHRTLLEHQPRAQRTPQSLIDKLERRTAGLEETAECVICQESMKEDAEDDRNLILLRLPCGHWFHDFCLRPWLEQCQTCPTCRSNVV